MTAHWIENTRRLPESLQDTLEQIRAAALELRGAVLPREVIQQKLLRRTLEIHMHRGRRVRFMLKGRNFYADRYTVKGIGVETKIFAWTFETPQEQIEFSLDDINGIQLLPDHRYPVSQILMVNRGSNATLTK
jgi:hypothetical protein